MFVLDEKGSADSGLLRTENKSYEPPADMANAIEADYDLPDLQNGNEIEGYNPENEGTAIKIEEAEEESGREKEEELKIKYDGKYNPRKKRTEYGIKFIEPNKEGDYTPQEIKAMKDEENGIVNASNEIEKELEAIAEETEKSETMESEEKKDD
ncbi:MAG: hypothetical protein JW716_05675 [Candidatus Aenigmarchaeota archaeon]|nr:hypothetical protein [Candidatus Aenigmarchaeota archaeon]